jgi:D-amino-acid dehydrogenase
MNENYEIAVVGGGIVGVSTALHLLMRGAKVALIDRGPPELATSYGNAGIVGTFYLLPFDPPPFSQMLNVLLNRLPSVHIQYRHLPKSIGWIARYYLNSRREQRRILGRLYWPLIADAIREHKTLMQGTDAERYLTAHGNAFLFRTEASFASKSLELEEARQRGVPYKIMSAAEFGDIEPDIKPIYSKALYWPGNVRLTNPGAVVTAYTEKFVRDGGKFLKAKAHNLQSNGDAWRVETSNGTIQAQQVALCTGPWTGDFFRPLGYRFPLEMKRGYHRHFSAIGGAKLAHAICDVDVGYYLCPMEQGYRITTGAEFAAVDAPPTPVQLDQVLPYARELFPLGEPVESKAWLGSRPCLPDSLPIIGPAPRHKNLWFNFAQNHAGLTSGPASGRLLAEMIRGEKTFCDPYPYRADRF